MSQETERKGILLFVDTDIFLDAVFSNHGKAVLEGLMKVLDGNEVFLLLPEVIQMEILEGFNLWRTDLLKTVQGNLETVKILGFKEAAASPSKTGVNNKGSKDSNADLVDGLIKDHRKSLIKTISEFYISMLSDLNKVFSHKNTEVIPLDDDSILQGMKRSLLKKAPHTNREKRTESQHTKDVDCIAFESLVSALKKKDAESTGHLAICVRDRDYHGDNGDLHQDITLEISMFDPVHYADLYSMFEKELTIQIIENKTAQSVEEEGLTLSPRSGVDSSDDAISKPTGSNLLHEL